jgi:hypothetical protein
MDTRVCKLSSLAEEKEPLIEAAFGPQIGADQRNNVSANQRFILLVNVTQAKLHHFRFLRRVLPRANPVYLDTNCVPYREGRFADCVGKLRSAESNFSIACEPSGVANVRRALNDSPQETGS